MSSGFTISFVVIGADGVPVSVEQGMSYPIGAGQDDWGLDWWLHRVMAAWILRGHVVRFDVFVG
jgi:hypothetical protein